MLVFSVSFLLFLLLVNAAAAAAAVTWIRICLLVVMEAMYGIDGFIVIWKIKKGKIKNESRESHWLA